MVGHPFDRDSVMDGRASSSSVAGGALAAPLGALAQQQDKAWRIGSFHFGSRQSSLDTARYGALASAQSLRAQSANFWRWLGSRDSSGCGARRGRVKNSRMMQVAGPSKAKSGSGSMSSACRSTRTAARDTTKSTRGWACAMCSGSQRLAGRCSAKPASTTTPVASGLSTLPSEHLTASPNTGGLVPPLPTDKVEATTTENRSSPQSPSWL